MVHAHKFPLPRGAGVLVNGKAGGDDLEGDTTHCETKLSTQRRPGCLALLPGDQTEAGFMSPLELWGKKRNPNVSTLRKGCACCGSVEAIGRGRLL